MTLKPILNQVHPVKGFVYRQFKRVKGAKGRDELEVRVEPRRGSRAVCSGCQNRRPGYDRLPARRFEFVPLWNIAVFLVYAMRRVDCPKCGIMVETVPWANGKHQLTTQYAWFLARWAKRMSWKEVATTFHTTWDKVYGAVTMAVAWGLAHRDLSNVTALGIDEVAWQRGHKYLTLVYQVDSHCRRLLWVGQDRTTKTLLRFFVWFGTERTRLVKFVVTDMWKAYLKVLAYKSKRGVLSAVHLLDRFHIAQNMNKAIDKVRASEAKKLKARGSDLLKHARWCVLKRPENLTDRQKVKLAELARCNNQTYRSYLLKEDFQNFWKYKSPTWAGKFLDRWCTMVMRSRIEPMKKMARSLRKHRALLLNWFHARGLVSLGAVEGFNNRVGLTFRRGYGHRSYKVAETALYHNLGGLPEPPMTHEFC